MEPGMDLQIISPNVSATHPNSVRLISFKTYSLITFINYGIITTAVSVIGIFVNCINVATFIKVGFKETIDVSLTALSISDMLGLVFLLLVSISSIDDFRDLVSHVMDMVQVSYLTAAVPRAYFTIVSGIITSIVAGERCLCVLKPLKVKTLMTKKKLLNLLVCICLVSMTPFMLVYYTTGLGLMFDPKINRSIAVLTFRKNRHQLDLICFTVTVAMYMATYVSVSVSTGVIVWKLASQSSWRAKRANNSHHKQPPQGSQVAVLEPETEKRKETKNNLSGKDKRATQTVTMIAAIYIVCYFPGALMQVFMAVIPEFNKGRMYEEFFMIAWSFVYIIEVLSANANILVYLKTSTRFKEAFVALFCTRTSGFKR